MPSCDQAAPPGATALGLCWGAPTPRGTPGAGAPGGGGGMTPNQQTARQTLGKPQGERALLSSPLLHKRRRAPLGEVRTDERHANLAGPAPSIKHAGLGAHPSRLPGSRRSGGFLPGEEGGLGSSGAGSRLAAYSKRRSWGPVLAAPLRSSAPHATARGLSSGLERKRDAHTSSYSITGRVRKEHAGTRLRLQKNKALLYGGFYALRGDACRSGKRLVDSPSLS